MILYLQVADLVGAKNANHIAHSKITRYFLKHVPSKPSPTTRNTHKIQHMGVQKWMKN